MTSSIVKSSPGSMYFKTSSSQMRDELETHDAVAFQQRARLGRQAERAALLIVNELIVDTIPLTAGFNV